MPAEDEMTVGIVNVRRRTTGTQMSSAHVLSVRGRVGLLIRLLHFMKIVLVELANE